MENSENRMLRSIDLPIYDLTHLDDVFPVMRPPLDGALADAHVHCGEGFAMNDRAVFIRLFCLSKLDNVMTANGPIWTIPEGRVNPTNTTWLEVPSRLGVEQVMVNCVRPESGNRFRLVHGNVKAIPDFIAQPSLFPSTDKIHDLLLGIEWNIHPKTEDGHLVMFARVRMLGGYLDRKSRIFHARDQREIIASDFGGETVSASPEPTGPRPRVIRV